MIDLELCRWCAWVLMVMRVCRNAHHKPPPGGCSTSPQAQGAVCAPALLLLACSACTPSCFPASVRGKLRKAGAVSRALFNAAFAYKLSLLKMGLPFGYDGAVLCVGHVQAAGPVLSLGPLMPAAALRSRHMSRPEPAHAELAS